MTQDTGIELVFNAVPKADASPIANADAARDLLHTVTEQQKEQATDNVRFFEYGRILVSLLDTFGKLALNLTDHVAHYDDELILRDDLDTDPEGRVTDACTCLGELHTAINVGKRHAHRYWSAISHLAVEFDPNASGDE